MPITKVVFYQDAPGKAPVVRWLERLRKVDPKAWANCRVRIEQLVLRGHELRRPAADHLRDGIYELRAKHFKVQYRILYFFDGKNVAILAHSIIKKGNEVGDHEIELAISRKDRFKAEPELHTYEEAI